MESKKSAKALTVTLFTFIVGCGLCCLPFIWPLVAGLLGLSALSFASSELACMGLIAGSVALVLALWKLKQLREKKNVCRLPAH